MDNVRFCEPVCACTVSVSSNVIASTAQPPLQLADATEGGSGINVQGRYAPPVHTHTTWLHPSLSWRVLMHLQYSRLQTWSERRWEHASASTGSGSA